MGSLDAPGIPVKTKSNKTFRKFDIKIQTIDSTDDSKETLTSHRPEVDRPLGSGCIVKDTPSGAVADCTETLVYGLYKEANSTTARIASDEDVARTLSVPTSGNATVAVIPPALEPTTPQTSVRSLGTHIDRRDSITDSKIDTVDSPGLNSVLPHN